MSKEDLLKHLHLQAHPEGGYYFETFRSSIVMDTERAGGQRDLLTSIYYLLTDDRPVDHFHINKSDIVHYFHGGSPVTYLLIPPRGPSVLKYKLGMDVSKGEVPQLMVPGGYWKAAILEEGEYGLLGEAVAPGFDFRDMEFVTQEQFCREFPDLWQEYAPYVRSKGPNNVK